VRFASVYRSFQDVDAFRDEVDKLKVRRRREPLEGQLSLLSAEDAAAKDAAAKDVLGKTKGGKRD
jgi:transcriptional repressor NrdR